jgi:predicted RNase H-like nuclease (RuvC/YqgF family)
MRHSFHSIVELLPHIHGVKVLKTGIQNLTDTIGEKDEEIASLNKRIAELEAESYNGVNKKNDIDEP